MSDNKKWYAECPNCGILDFDIEKEYVDLNCVCGKCKSELKFSVQKNNI